MAKIIIDRDLLSRALTVLVSGMPSKHIIPADGVFKFDIEKEKCNITISNSAVEMKIYIPCKSDEEVSFTTPHYIMQNTVQNFPEGDLKIVTTRNKEDTYTKQIHISPEGQRKKYKVACDPYENDFPYWPAEEEPNVLVKFKSNMKEFQERVNITGQNVDPQDPTQVYQNISLVNNDGKIKFVGGNAHLCLGVDSDFAIEDSVVIPALISKCMSQLSQGGEAEIEVTDKVLYFNYSSFSLKLKMYEMTAPPYMTLFNQEPEKGVVIDRIELLGGLKRMMGVGMKNHRVVLECKDNSLHITSENVDFGHEGEEYIDVEGEGTWMVGANCLYLKNAIGSSKSDKVEIKVIGNGSQNKPIFVVPQGDTTQMKWLIMPVAISRVEG